MANKKLQATAELFLNTKNAQKDAQAFVNNLKQKLSEIESAADKMTVFKDVVEYIAHIDRALTALKAKNTDVFNSTFGNLDADLKKQLEGIFGIDGTQLGQIDVLREKLATLTPKSSIGELRDFAKEINGLFASIGMNEPLDIEKQFKGKAGQKHIDLLTNALTNFATVWKDVNIKVAQGFSFGEGKTGAPDGGDVLSEIQMLINNLEKKNQELLAAKERLKTILKDFGNVNKTGVLDNYSVELTAESIQSLTLEYDKLQTELENADSSSAQFYNTLSRLVEVSLQLKKASSDVSKDKSLIDVFKNTPAATGTQDSSLYASLSRYAESKNPMNRDMQRIISRGGLQDAINSNSALIEDLKAHNDINAVLQKRINLYDTLKSKLQAAQEEYKRGETLEDIDAADESVEILHNMKAEILKLVGASDNKMDVMDNIFDGFADSAFTAESALQKLYQMLEMETPDQFKVRLESLVAESKTAAEIIRDTGITKSKTETTATSKTTGSGVSEVDFANLENTIKTETASIISALDGNTFKVEVVKDNTEDIRGAINDISSAVQQIANHFTVDKNQTDVDNMKENLRQLLDVVNQHNAGRTSDGSYQQQELSIGLLSDGSLSVNYGDNGRVSWGHVAETLLGNLDKTLLADLHSHPLKEFLSSGQTYVSDSFSGAQGDLGAFQFSQSLGAKIAGMITGNVMRVLDLSAISPDMMTRLHKELQSVEDRYLNSGFYSDYIGRDKNGKIAAKYQDTFEGRHEVTKVMESILYESLKGVGYSKDKIENQIFKKYNLTDDAQLTDLATRLVGLVSSAEQAAPPIERLSEILRQFGYDPSSKNAKVLLDAYNKGELKASDVFNQLSNDGDRVSEAAIQSLLNIDSSKQTSQIESLLTNISSILSNINAIVGNIENSTRLSGEQQLNNAIKDIADLRSGIVSDNLNQGVEHVYNDKDATKYRYADAEMRALDAINNFVDDLKVKRESDGFTFSESATKDALDLFSKFKTAITYLQDFERQTNLYTGGRNNLGLYVDPSDGKILDTYDKMSDMLTSGDVLDALLNQLRSVKDKEFGADGALGNRQLQASIEVLAASVSNLNSIMSSFNGMPFEQKLPKMDNIFDDEPSNEFIDASQDDAINNEIAQLEKLKSQLLEVKAAVDAKTQAFEEEYVTVDGAVDAEIVSLQSLVAQLAQVVEKIGLINSGFNSLNTNIPDIKLSDKPIDNEKKPDTDSSGDKPDSPPEDAFSKSLRNQKASFTEYRKSLADVDYLSAELRAELDRLAVNIQQVGDKSGLDAFRKDLEKLKKEIAIKKSTHEAVGLGSVNSAQNKLKTAFNSLTRDQQSEDVQREYNTAMEQLQRYEATVREGKVVELQAIHDTTDALLRKLEAMRQVNKEQEQTQKKNAKFGHTTMINAAAKHNKLNALATNAQFAGSEAVSGALLEYNAAYEELVRLQNEINNKGPVASKEDEIRFQAAKNACNDYAKSLQKLIDNSLKLHEGRANKDAYMLGDDFDYLNDDGRKTALSNFAQEMYGVTLSAENFKKGFKEAVFEVKNGDGTFTQMTAKFTDARNEIVALAGNVKKTQGTFGAFFDELKGKFKSIGAYLIASFSFHEVWQVIRQGVNYVREIDSALTELKKVTDGTDASYARFLQDMSKTGSVIGATVKDLTTMASEWARLGYSMEEAGKLAESTAILLNVSEFDDATVASEALISTMQAFQYTADESEHVVDILNEVGNNYAISSDGIATALQDSASALMEAGNNLEQSVALVAAANKVVQDPNSVGSALRTISLRLRGTSVEILEGLGEETDGAVESISKMQEKIEALTGVNILTNSGAYKDTYTILREIGNVWEDISDIDQAALLELMAGKNRANTLAAILGNMEDLEGAYESSLQAEGSALKENEAYLNSIQGRIDLFSNSVQTMWMNFINADAVKFIVDLGTGLIKAIDHVGVLNTAIAGLFAGLFAKHQLKKKNIGILDAIFDIAPAKIKKGLTSLFDSQMGNIANQNISKLVASGATEYERYAEALQIVSAAKQAEILINNGVSESEQLLILTKTLGSEAAAKQAIENAKLAASHTMVSASMVGELVNTGVLSAEQGAAAISTLGLVTAEGESVVVTKASALAKLEDAVATGALNAADKDAIVSTLGLGASNVITAATFEALAAKIWSAITALWAFLTTNPVGWAILATTAITGVVAAYNAWGPTHENLIEKLEEETTAYKEVQNELQNVQSELETTGDRIDELNAKGSLSFAEEEELNRLERLNDELERQERILAAQEQRARSEQIDAALKAMGNDPDLASYDVSNPNNNYAANAKARQTSGTIPYAAGLQNPNEQINTSAERQANKWERNLENLKNAKADLDAANKALDETLYASNSKQYKKLEKDVEDAQARVDEYNNAIDSMNDTWLTKYGEVGYVENATTEADKRWNELYRQRQDYLDQQALINGDYGKDIVLDRVFGTTGTEAAQKFKKEFEKAIDGGSDPADVITEMLNSQDYSSAFTGLEEQFGITMDNIKDYFTQTGEFAIDYEFDITKYTKYISSHSAAISEYQEAIQKLGKGSFTMDDFMSLIKKYPDLAKGVDISSNAFYGLSRNLNKAIKSKTKDFVKDLEKLRESMKAAGKETDSIEQLIEAVNKMPGDALDSAIDKYGTLADKISEAKVASDQLLASMEENPNEGYENRGEAMEYMKAAMERGEIGSESNLWNVAGKYGFTSDETDLNKKADELANYIAVRDKWFKTADDGDGRTSDEYNHEGAINFIKDVEKVVEASKNAEGEAKRLSEILSWTYDETTGEFNFDYANENLPEIIKLLGESKELIKLNEQEWHDLMIQVGQYFGINWDKASDVKDYIEGIHEGSGSASDKIDAMTASVETYLEKTLGQDLDFSNMTDEAIAQLGNTDREIRELIERYFELKDALQDPLNIESTISQTGSVASLVDMKELSGSVTDGFYGYNFVDADVFKEALTQAGYTEEKIQSLIEKVKEFQNVIVTSNDDPLGLESIDGRTTAFIAALNQAGVEYKVTRDEITNNPVDVKINTKSLIATLQEQGWSPEKIKEYLQTLTSTESGLGVTLDVATDQIDAAIAESAGLTKTETVTVDIAGTAPDGISEMQKGLFGMTSQVHTVTVDVDVVGDPLPNIPTSAAMNAGLTKFNANGNFHISGGAFASGTVGAPKTEGSLVGELGPELIVDPSSGRWHTVGEHGAEFTEVKRGQIIFNHKQTEQLLKNGYVTGRGRLQGGDSAFASGTAFAYGGGTFGRYEFDGKGGWTEYDVNNKVVDSMNGTTSALSKAAEALSNASDEFSEVFDWIEVRIEELDETLGLLESQIENAVHYSEKNTIIDDLIDTNKVKLDNLEAGYQKYADYAAELLTKVPREYHDAVKNGAIEIEAFVGEVDEKTLEAIQNYREWAQKAADFKQQANEILTTIRDLAIQKFDNAYEAGNVRATVEDSQTEKLQNAVDYDEERGLITSDAYYIAMMENSNKKIEYLTNAREAMQKELNAAVEAGQIQRGSNEWYELLDQMYQIDSEIDQATIELEEFQNAINDLYWDNFDQLINRLDYLSNETKNLIDLMDSEDMVIDPVKRKYENGTVEYWTADDVEWSKEGLASLGLYAQQMEIAEYKAKQYAEAIDDLTKEYNAGHYSENEYYEKLNELKDAQYESIEAYESAKESIVDLNKTRIDSIKNGIQKETEAYEELIKTKKEALDAEKD